MYEAFDPYLSREAWYSSHDKETEVFNICLQRVVDDPAFDPQKMAEYMKRRVGADDEEGMFYNAIENRLAEAYAIRDFLQQTRR